MELLKLVALDRDDLEVVSTHLQDATLTVGDVRWRPSEKRHFRQPCGVKSQRCAAEGRLRTASRLPGLAARPG